MGGKERQREWQEMYTEDKRDVEEDPAVHSWRQIDSQEESAMKAFVGFSVLHSKLHTDWYRSCTCKGSQELDLWSKSGDMTSHIEKHRTYEAAVSRDVIFWFILRFILWAKTESP